MELLRVVFRHYRWPFLGALALSLVSAGLGVGVIAFINQRLIDALFGNASPDGPEPNRDEPSHMHLERDERGEPMAARFTYVDEESCIGCTHCSHVARNTFFMEEDHGREKRK